jgi:hypothetical protein
MKTRFNRRPVLALTVVMLAGLACNFFSHVPEAPLETIPVTTEAVENLKQDLQDAAQTAQETGKISVEIDEAELTSLLAFELQDQTNIPFNTPQVYLRDGVILVTGFVTQENVSLPVTITVAVTVDAQGMPNFAITAAKLGSLPLPEAMVSQFSEEIARAFNESIRPRLGTMIIESITIAEGKMTITGRTN